MTTATPPAKPQRYMGPATLVDILHMTDMVRQFTFALPEEAGTFREGQFSQMHLEKEGKPHRKSYSIASPPSLKNHIQLCVNLVPGGFVSTWFFSLEVGAKVQVSLPYGVFGLPQELPHTLVFVGTGTGISPLRSMIHTLFERGCDKEIYLIYGNRYEADILYRDEWEGYIKAHKNFHFIPTLSRDEQWQGEKAYVQDVVQKHFGERWEGIHFFGCGLTAMCKTLKEQLLSMGVPKEFMHFEQFV